MEIGWCARLERADQVKAIGYDFLEVALAPLGLEEDASFQAAKALARNVTFPMPVFNQFLPRDMRIVGPAVDRTRIQRYLANAAELMHAAHAEIVVFGSGWTRNIPEGWSREQAVSQFLEMVSWCTGAFDGTGIVVAIEAQNRKETNFIVTVGEAVALAKTIGRPDVRAIADIYHMYEEDESFDVIRTSSEWVVHVHLSDTGRTRPGTGWYDYGGFFDCLKASGYEGRLSVEMMTEIPETEIRRSLEVVLGRWAA